MTPTYRIKKNDKIVRRTRVRAGGRQVSPHTKKRKNETSNHGPKQHVELGNMQVSTDVYKLPLSQVRQRHWRGHSEVSKPGQEPQGQNFLGKNIKLLKLV